MDCHRLIHIRILYNLIYDSVTGEGEWILVDTEDEMVAIFLRQRIYFMQQQKLLSLIRQAIEDYNMIEEGDKIAVGVSGGKDSLALLHAMKILNRFYPKKFELYAITCNVGFEGMDFTGVRKFCESINVPYEQVDTEIAKIVFEDNKDERPCSLCAKLRKGAMYKRLGELGINKIAYAHNKDDFIETALMSLIFEGRFYAFPPVTYLPEAGVTVIRPMMYVPEKGVANFVINQGIKVVKNTCPVDGSTKREYAKQLMEQINRDNPGTKDRIMHAVVNGRFEDWPEVHRN